MNMKLYGRKSTKPLKAIRLFCGECMGMSRRIKTPSYPVEDVRGCVDDLCPLLDFRFGKNPYLKGKSKGNPEALKIYRKTQQETRK